MGEYIRNRRLSLAGAELAAGDVKVIDVAMKYGYKRRFAGVSGEREEQEKQRSSSLRNEIHFGKVRLCHTGFWL